MMIGNICTSEYESSCYFRGPARYVILVQIRSLGEEVYGIALSSNELLQRFGILFSLSRGSIDTSA